MIQLFKKKCSKFNYFQYFNKQFLIRIQFHNIFKKNLFRNELFLKIINYIMNSKNYLISRDL